MLVSRPQPIALSEAARTSAELAALGVVEQHLVINGLIPQSEGATDPTARGLVEREREALQHAPQTLRSLIHDQISLRAGNVMGVAALRPSSPGEPPAHVTVDATAPIEMGHLADLVRLAPAATDSIMTMGKGGVGKTTIAASLALSLAQQACPCT